MPRSVVAWLLVSALACGGDDDTPMLDGGARADATIDAQVIEPPAPDPPAPPSLTPCPSGWREIDVEGVAACDPWPEGGRLDCPPGDAHFLGEPGCTRLGRDCPPGDFADDLPAGTLYVRQGATSGDGSRTAPFATIAEAVAVAPSDGTIAIGRGTYPEGVRVDAGSLTLRGACTAATTIQRPFGSVSALRLAAGATVVVEDLTILGPGAPLVRSVGGHLTLRGAALRGGNIQCEGGSLALEGVELAEQTDASVFEPFVGVTNADVLTIRRVLLRDSFGVGIQTGNIAETTLEDIAIDDVGLFGLALFGSTPVPIRRLHLADVRGTAIQATGPVTIEDAVVERPLPDVGTVESGIGIAVFGAVDARFDRIRIEQPLAAGLLLAAGARVTAADVIIRESAPELTAESYGRGIELGSGATLSLDRAVLASVRDVALLATEATTAIDARDLTIVEVAPNGLGFFGRAAHAQLGATIAVERARMSGAHEATLTAAGPGSSTSCIHCDVGPTLARGCATTTCREASAGIGAASMIGGSIRLERFRLHESALCGLQIATGGVADLVDGAVEQNPIGVNIQTSPFDIERVTSNVVYRDNGTNLDTLDLPVPDSMVR